MYTGVEIKTTIYKFVADKMDDTLEPTKHNRPQKQRHP